MCGREQATEVIWHSLRKTVLPFNADLIQDVVVVEINYDEPKFLGKGREHAVQLVSGARCFSASNRVFTGAADGCVNGCGDGPSRFVDKRRIVEWFILSHNLSERTNDEAVSISRAYVAISRES